MSDLKEKTCLPCRSGAPALTDADIDIHLSQVPAWHVAVKDGVKRIEREFAFGDFRTAMEFAAKVGELAQAEDHHPELHISWGKLVVETWTHTIRGLHLNDFILAAKTDLMYEKHGRP